MEKRSRNSSRFDNEKKIFSLMLLATGIFAIVGGLYTWGKGPIFSAPLGTDLKLFISDIIIAGPFSIIATIGIWKCRYWGLLFCWFVCGVYLYGSIAVFVMLIQEGAPYSLELIIPPIFGTLLSIMLLIWTKKNIHEFLEDI